MYSFRFVPGILVLLFLGQCALGGNVAGNGTTADSSVTGPSFQILTAALTDVLILEFVPAANPPVLKELKRFPGVIRNAAYPWVVRHPFDKNTFIIANDNHDLGELTSFHYEPTNYNLSVVDRVYTQGSCAHIAVSPDGSTVHVANLYGNNNQGPNGALIPFDVSTGKFGKVNVPQFLNFSDYQLLPGQINASQLLRHPHHWAFHPYLPVAYLSDLGADLVRRYKINGPGDLTPLDPIKQKIASGPRRSIIHPSGRAMYTLHEIDSTLSVNFIDTTTPYGNVTVMQEGVDMLKPGANHSANVFQGSEFQLSNDGRFLYAAARNNTSPPKNGTNDDPIAIFSVSTNGTHIERLGFVPSHNWYLRYFGLSPAYEDQTYRAEKYLISGGQMSNDTSIFSRDARSGNLTLVARYVSEGDSPTSYVWL